MQTPAGKDASKALGFTHAIPVSLAPGADRPILSVAVGLAIRAQVAVTIAPVVTDWASHVV
jgi:hypothetical protein